MPDLSSVAEKTAVLIPAHNEGKRIFQTVKKIRELSPHLPVIVIADRCEDNTEEEAKKAGAIVLKKTEGSEKEGKGGVIRWFLKNHKWLLKNHEDIQKGMEYLIILDADSQLISGDLTDLIPPIQNGATASQAMVVPVEVNGYLPTVFSALSEWSEQVFTNQLRRKLGWSVPLKGTGMAFSIPTLLSYLDHLKTHTEDQELTLLIRSRKGKIAFVPQIQIGDPKPKEDTDFVSQRARWLRGKWDTISYHKDSLKRMVLSFQPQNLFLLRDTIFTPRTIRTPLLFFFFLSSFLLPPTPIFWILRALLGFLFLLDISPLLYGFFTCPREWKKGMKISLLDLLTYPLLWGKSFFLSRKTKGKWFKVER
jgi:cellulose synthase/poly-beta-1,6-N-acetylglucosamine synthase-like glycosyltransferase